MESFTLRLSMVYFLEKEMEDIFTDMTEDTFGKLLTEDSGIGNRRTMDYFGCATGKRRRTMAQSDFEEKLEIEKFHIESDVRCHDRR